MGIVVQGQSGDLGGCGPVHHYVLKQLPLEGVKEFRPNTPIEGPCCPLAWSREWQVRLVACCKCGMLSMDDIAPDCRQWVLEWLLLGDSPYDHRVSCAIHDLHFGLVKSVAAD